MAKGKCVLAYSGGMDSTISVVWIKENYDLDVITLTVDLGAGPEIEGVAEKAKKAGAIDSVILDVKDEFVNEYIFPGLKAGAMYEDVYALSTALARPLMSKKLVEVARKAGCNDAVLFNFGKNLPIQKIISCKKIGLTSGASAPEKLVQDFISEVKKHINVNIEEFINVKENVTFKLPPTLN